MKYLRRGDKKTERVPTLTCLIRSCLIRWALLLSRERSYESVKVVAKAGPTLSL